MSFLQPRRNDPGGPGRTFRRDWSKGLLSGLWGRRQLIGGSAPKAVPTGGEGLASPALVKVPGAWELWELSGVAAPSSRAYSVLSESWAPEASKAHVPWRLPAALWLVCEQTSTPQTCPGWDMGVWHDDEVPL